MSVNEDYCSLYL